MSAASVPVADLFYLAGLDLSLARARWVEDGWPLQEPDGTEVWRYRTEYVVPAPGALAVAS